MDFAVAGVYWESERLVVKQKEQDCTLLLPDELDAKTEAQLPELRELSFCFCI